MNSDSHSTDSQLSDNPDPITGAPGAHPVGTGVGAAGGAAAGAAIGTAVAGPVGTLVGGVIGAVAGGLSGKAAAEVFDPTAEEAYWREAHGQQAYASPAEPYEHYQHAYRVGYEGAYLGPDLGTFEEAEPELQAKYESGETKLPWMKVRVATQSAWTRAKGRLGSIGPARTSGGVYGG